MGASLDAAPQSVLTASLPKHRKPSRRQIASRRRKRALERISNYREGICKVFASASARKSGLPCRVGKANATSEATRPKG
jgi:hypothetical protein